MNRVTGYYEYTTVDGDTFDSLALDMYDDEMLANYIIDVNPDYCDVVVFDAGVELKLPIMAEVESTDTIPPWRQQSE